MSTKGELTKTIETQQNKITRLEQRLADVVTAYKSLKKEKEALESTVRVISSATTTESPATTDNEANATPRDENETSTENEQTSVQDKVQTLQQALAVITEQKNSNGTNVSIR